MLHQVLRELETAQEAVDLNQLAHKLGVERSALQGMIQFWVRKGRLKDDRQEAQAANVSCACAAECRSSCGEVQGCPFLMKLPRTYSLKLPRD